MQKPSIGAIVHVVANDCRHAPAIITARVEMTEYVNVDAFEDPMRAYSFAAPLYDVPHDEKDKAIGTWHWPEKED